MFDEWFFLLKWKYKKKMDSTNYIKNNTIIDFTLFRWYYVFSVKITNT